MTSVFVAYGEIEGSEFIGASNRDYPQPEDLEIQRDMKKAGRVKRGIITTFGHELYYYITLAFRSHRRHKDTVIARLIKGAYIYGAAYLSSAEDVPMEFVQMVRDVQHEMTYLREHLKFREIPGDYLLAEMEPRSNLIDLMTDYYKICMPEDQFIILDRSHRKLSLYNRGKALYFDIGSMALEDVVRVEFIELCWIEFYRKLKEEERGKI